MNVLVTGAMGFLGCHLTDVLLARGQQVTALARPGKRSRSGGRDELTVIEAALDDRAAIVRRLGRGRFDVCVHLAWAPAAARSEPGEQLAALRSSLLLVEVLADLECPRLVAAGSCLEYAASDEVLTERAPVEPRDLYGAAKVAFFRAAEQLCTQLEIRLVWPRIFYVYGPNEDPRRLVPSVIHHLLRGEQAPTTSGEQVRDYSHARDVAEALWMLCTSDVGGVVNIASGRPLKVKDLVLRIGQLMGRESLLCIGALPYRAEEPPVIRGDPAMLRGLGWAPRTDLDAGLVETIDWWRARA